MVINMNLNYFSITYWFNIFADHSNFLNILSDYFKDEFQSLNIKNQTNNLVEPIIIAFNNEKKTNINMSQINLQYNMDNVSLKNFEEFKNKALEIFELLNLNNVIVSHVEILINGEKICENALEMVTKNTINPNIVDKDIVDTTLKIGKKYDDLFYKVITILNKKQIKLPKKIDEHGRVVPIPLISWNGALVENELVDISYEINDKYSFDFTKNYHTTTFYLNKMLYILENDFESDIKNLLENGYI